jgi:MraZ protein
MSDLDSFGATPRQRDFVGSFLHVVDSQGRVQLPRALRQALGSSARDTLVVTRGLDGCLAAYPQDRWRSVREQWMEAARKTDGRWARNLIRCVTSYAIKTRVDAQGRINLSPDLLDLAGITDEATIVGALEWIEIWSPERFALAIDEVDDNYDESTANLMVVHPAKQANGDG